MQCSCVDQLGLVVVDGASERFVTNERQLLPDIRKESAASTQRNSDGCYDGCNSYACGQDECGGGQALTNDSGISCVHTQLAKTFTNGVAASSKHPSDTSSNETPMHTRIQRSVTKSIFRPSFG